MKPEKYPLPWCEYLDMPYWQINFSLCAYPEWRAWQKKTEISLVYAEIDKLYAEGKLEVKYNDGRLLFTSQT